MRYHHHGDGFGVAHWIGAGLVFLILVAILVALGVILARLFRRGSSAFRLTPTSGSRAVEILDERFARGEIDADEYSQRRALLRPSDTS